MKKVGLTGSMVLDKPVARVVTGESNFPQLTNKVKKVTSDGYGKIMRMF
jgi:hypothetical protein